MRIGVDTSMLAYAEGVNDPDRKSAARSVLDRLAGAPLVLPLQVSLELFRVLIRKLRLSPAEAGSAVRAWHAIFPHRPDTTSRVLDAAFELAAGHRFQIFDAVILAATAEAGGRLLLSEDMGDGFVWRGVTIANPFAPKPHPLLATALSG